MTEPQFPKHPFWNYSLELYGAEGVQRACLELQDEVGLDVNMLLFCIWTGVDGPGEITPEELRECIVRTTQWQDKVVQPLRYIRRMLKQDNLGATDELVAILRPEVQKAELAAEHTEQLLLAGLVPAARAATGLSPALANLRAYMDRLGVAPDGATRVAVLAILGPAFPDISAAQLATQWGASLS
jgi:uncharacterized protein (TIGR02444 family)